MNASATRHGGHPVALWLHQSRSADVLGSASDAYRDEVSGADMKTPVFFFYLPFAHGEYEEHTSREVRW